MHEPELDLAVTLAAEVGREVRGPQLLGFHLVLECADDAHEAGLVGVQDLERIDLVVDELAHPLELGLELRLGRKIPGHDSIAMPSSIMPVMVLVNFSYIGSGLLPRRWSMRL